jgi:hypothetical protein
MNSFPRNKLNSNLSLLNLELETVIFCKLPNGLRYDPAGHRWAGMANVSIIEKDTEGRYTLYWAGYFNRIVKKLLILFS